MSASLGTAASGGGEKRSPPEGALEAAAALRKLDALRAAEPCNEEAGGPCECRCDGGKDPPKDWVGMICSDAPTAPSYRQCPDGMTCRPENPNCTLTRNTRGREGSRNLPSGRFHTGRPRFPKVRSGRADVSPT